MRFSQLIEKDTYTSDLEDDIVNLLTISSSKGYNKIKTSKLVKDLRNMGYDVSDKTIHIVLDNLDIVINADNNVIEISTDNPSGEDEFGDINQLDVDTNTAFDDVPEDEQEFDSVDKAAQKQAMKDITQ